MRQGKCWRHVADVRHGRRPGGSRARSGGYAAPVVVSPVYSPFASVFEREGGQDSLPRRIRWRAVAACVALVVVQLVVARLSGCL